MQHRRFVRLLSLIFVFWATPSYCQELTLPVYSLSIDPAFLDSLELNPTSSQTYPAQLEYEDDLYDCQVRYRGASSLNLPKKSWKVYFGETGPMGWEETNLNAEYRDVSICRNYLSMALTRFVGLPAPDTRFISLLINDLYYGVYLEIEMVGDRFYDERDLGDGAIFKAVSHGARFAPPLYSEKLTDYYAVKSSIGCSLDTLGARLTFIQNADPAHVGEYLDQIVDADNLLRYFAVQFSIANHDGLSKNFYLHPDEDNRYMLVPWDCDATFGNSWQGEYIGLASQLWYNQLNHQAVFQRLMSIPGHHAEFLCSIDMLITSGFESIGQTLTATYDEIRHDVYLDTLKKGTNEEFDDELDVILNWMDERASYLTNLNYFNRMEIVSSRVTPDYLSSAEDTVHFEVEMDQHPFNVQVAVFDSSYEISYYSLNDDGMSGDSCAGDMIYSVNLTFPELSSPIYYCFLVKPTSSEGYPTPPSGWFNFEYHPLALPCIQHNEEPPLPAEIEIDDFSQDPLTGTHYFAVINSSDRSIDISGCVVRLGNTYRKLRLPPMETLTPAETLLVTNHYDWIACLKPEGKINGGFYFAPSIGDTVFLETSAGSALASRVVSEIHETFETVGSVAINEINYNSSEEFDPGDWVELCCREEVVDLSGWTLKDSHDDHFYLIPEGTLLLEDEYLVIAEDPDAFAYCFPDVINAIGGFYFGLNAGGEDIRIFDDAGILVDWVAYDDDDPWPEEPDGNGPTLELINPDYPNYCYENWRASSDSFYYGTPGAVNSVYIWTPDLENVVAPFAWEISSVYPNPFNGTVRISFTVPRPGEVVFSVHDILGRRVTTLREMVPSAGRYSTAWNGRNGQGTAVGSGMYFILMDGAASSALKKVVLIK